jgi:bis(5'-nucleosyl)-tetraphosphatase (symmetrical)
MAVWAIGDLQGCYGPTQRLLEKIGFDPTRDRLWFCGDLVNRGGESVETLRLVHSLRENVVSVLGNHDLSLLAIAERREEEQRKVNPDLQGVLFAHDRDVLLDWLRARPLLHADRALGWMMVHAGLAPKWTTAMAEKHAREVEQKLRGNGAHKLRYCSPRGRIAFEHKDAPGTQPPGLYPWYEVPGRAERDLRIACGHWSTLGLFIGHGVHALDTGAVWGGKLTALQLDSEDLRVVQVPGRDAPARPKAKKDRRSRPGTA